MNSENKSYKTFGIIELKINLVASNPPLMATAKTIMTDESVEKFLRSLEDDQVKKDCYILRKILTDLTGEEPKMWGTSIIGFGKYHYKYDSGHEGDSALVGMSPRKNNISLYLAPGFTEEFADLLPQLGKAKTGKGCLYIKAVEDIDLIVLKKLIRSSIQFLRERYGE